MKAILSLVLSCVIASQTSDAELEHKNDFIAFDLNHDGFVDASEVRSQF